jgi:hypothetical protein
MRQRIAIAVFAAAAIAAYGAHAACPGQPLPHQKDAKEHAKGPKPANGCVDLNGVPQISQGIVAAERVPPAVAAGQALAKTPVAAVGPDLPPDPGIRVGLTKLDPGVKPVPTVGYHWSLD